MTETVSTGTTGTTKGTGLTLGIELALASDIVVAADDTVFAQLEVARAILPFGGATTRFAGVAGWGNAMRWMLTGDRFDAAEAHRMGLVQEVVPAGEQLTRARELAGRIAAQAPLAVQATLANARLAVSDGEAAAASRLPGPQRFASATPAAARVGAQRSRPVTGAAAGSRSTVTEAPANSWPSPRVTVAS